MAYSYFFDLRNKALYWFLLSVVCNTKDSAISFDVLQDCFYAIMLLLLRTVAFRSEWKVLVSRDIVTEPLYWAAFSE